MFAWVGYFEVTILPPVEEPHSDDSYDIFYLDLPMIIHIIIFFLILVSLV